MTIKGCGKKFRGQDMWCGQWEQRTKSLRVVHYCKGCRAELARQQQARIKAVWN